MYGKVTSLKLLEMFVVLLSELGHIIHMLKASVLNMFEPLA